jgi:hypothetical protein
MEVKMNGPCGKYEEKKDIYSVRVGKTEGTKNSARPRYIWEDNIKLNLKMYVGKFVLGSLDSE